MPTERREELRQRTVDVPETVREWSRSAVHVEFYHTPEATRSSREFSLLEIVAYVVCGVALGILACVPMVTQAPGVTFGLLVIASAQLVGAGFALWVARHRKRAAYQVVGEARGLPDYAPLFLRVLEVFGESGLALSWLHEPNPSLSGRTPLEAAKTDLGRAEVLDILGRIEHGVIS